MSIYLISKFKAGFIIRDSYINVFISSVCLIFDAAELRFNPYGDEAMENYVQTNYSNVSQAFCTNDIMLHVQMFSSLNTHECSNSSSHHHPIMILKINHRYDSHCICHLINHLSHHLKVFYLFYPFSIYAYPSQLAYLCS